MARPTKHNQPKTASLFARITPDGKDGLGELAAKKGISLAELLERIGRGEIELDQSADQQLGESQPN
jgi:hypothetical protein